MAKQKNGKKEGIPEVTETPEERIRKYRRDELIVNVLEDNMLPQDVADNMLQEVEILDRPGGITYHVPQGFVRDRDKKSGRAVSQANYSRVMQFLYCLM